MTRRELSERVASVAAILVSRAGGYLHNTIREPRVTCDVCALPVEGYLRCPQCNNLRAEEGSIADRVGAMVYAEEYGSQAYKLMRAYKTDAPTEEQQGTIAGLLAVGLAGHGRCVWELAGQRAMYWCTVPSLSRGDREHPLHHLVAGLPHRAGSEILVRSADEVVSPRSFRPANFLISSSIPADAHVLVVDDSWATGAHAQSVAGALKRAGAATVSILVIARILSPAWRPNAEFVKNRLVADFDPQWCPWTGGDCPPPGQVT